MALIVPDKFNRNHPHVQAMASPAVTGLWLIQYMCERLGLADLAGLDVLDFGCGSRFADTIVNLEVPLKSYVGVDVYKEMIDFLATNVIDPRLLFVHINARNSGYNPTGEPLSSFNALPLDGCFFDVVCMFSVITHQLPEDALAIFRLLRKCVRENGRLFFSAILRAGELGYCEDVPEQPTAISVYSPGLLRELLWQAKWHVLSVEPPRPGGVPIMDSLLCMPTR